MIADHFHFTGENMGNMQEPDGAGRCPRTNGPAGTSVRATQAGLAGAAILTLLLPATGANSLIAQMPPGVERDPSAARLAYDDLDRFAEAYRRLPAISDTAALLDSAYLAGASVGLTTYARMYDVDAAVLAAALRATPRIFRRTAMQGPVAVRGIEAELRAAFRRLAARYPEALFPPVFFLVGRNHAGGAVQAEGILIAAETYVRREGGKGRPVRKIDDLVHLVAHELAHYQQAAYDVERYQRSNSLLARAIKEGAADYVAELLTGAHINPVAHAYGNRHEWNLWSRFRCEMDATETGDWFFARPRDPTWPNDLGYYVGYRIAALRYAQETSFDGALAALLRVDDYEAFLCDSGYEAYLEEREGRRFANCRG